MNSLFLFFTQAEGGAKSYLSRQGEESAENLSESLSQFILQTLQLDLSKNFEARAHSLSEDVVWRHFKDQNSLYSATEASLNLEPNIIVLSGGHFRSQRTCEAVATQLALPICVDERLDADTQLTPNKEGLKEALGAWSEWLKKQKTPPRLVLIGTSLQSLIHWLSKEMTGEKFEETEKVMREMTQNDLIPGVFAAGYSSENIKQPWIFD